MSDVVFTHSADVRAEAERRWGRRPHVHTIPIGSYEGAYPQTLSRDEARRKLGISDDAFTFVFFGNVRPYKGLDILIEAFRNVQRDFPRAHLVIAGRPFSPEFADRVRTALRDVPNAQLALGHVPDEEVQDYMLAGDCFVAPYKYIETSSAIYLALAFGLPVIIKSEGNVVDFSSHDIGVLMRDSRETADAMRHFLGMSPGALQQLRKNARTASRAFSWEQFEPRYRDAFAAFESEQEPTPVP